MQRFQYIFFILFACNSCEDVIQVDTVDVEPRLIIDALIRVDINEELIPIKVKVTTTTNFFEATPVASLESIVMLTEINDVNGFVQILSSTLAEIEPGSGIYYPDPCAGCKNNIKTTALNEYTVFSLYITHNDKNYYAETKYIPVVPIDKLEVGDNTLFSDNEKEVIVTFTDNPETDDYYLFDFDYGNYLVTDDQFYKGQQYEFSYFYDHTFESNTKAKISIIGIDEPLFNYMDQLIEQSEASQGPFQTPVSTVKGNIFEFTGLDNINRFDNTDRPYNFPLGYFAIVQEIKSELIINKNAK